MALDPFLTPEMRRNMLDLLASMLWADGVAEPDELSALRAAAAALGETDADAIDASVSRGALVSDDAGVTFGMQPMERAMAYAAGAWMAAVGNPDGRGEVGFLTRLRELLGLSTSGAEKLETLARRVRGAGGVRPSPAEFEALLMGAGRLGLVD